MVTSDKVIFKTLANIYLLRKSINTNFATILMPLSLTLHNYDKILWYKSYVPSKNIYIHIYTCVGLTTRAFASSDVKGKGCCQCYTHLAEVLQSLWTVEEEPRKIKP